MLNLDEKLKNLPQKPGVYLMKNGDGQIIYVGKAINLRSRVRQYFQSSKSHSAKVHVLVENIEDFEYIITKNELEALVLECNLIKKHRPRYNVTLKDDKHYPYIKITLNESFPRVIIVREIIKDKGKYFGPFTDSNAVKQTINLIKKIFPVRSCNKNIEKIAGKERPCLNAHINRCLAPCTGKVSKEEYDDIIKNVCLFLEGKQQNLITELKEKMNRFSENLEFEKAADIRDQLEAVNKINEEQVAVSSRLEDLDIIAYEVNGKLVSVQIFFVRLGKIVGRENFFLSDIGESEAGEIIDSFIKQYYNKAVYMPKNILVSTELEEKDIIEKWLSDKKGSKVRISVPYRGEKRKLMQMAKRNAAESLRLEVEKTDKDKEKTTVLMSELAEILNISNSIHRIEAFDISNIQGVDNVGSMIVFEGGKPVKKHYRRFKIKGFVGQDDYASMREIVERRIMRGLDERNNMQDQSSEYKNGKFSKLPDLIFVDGGLNQVNSIIPILEKYNLDIPVCGMVKDNRHRTRGLIYKGKEVLLSSKSEVFKLIVRIQDEAHRFAITYHRSLMRKKVKSSILDEIPGVGATRKNALLKHFKNMEEIKTASMDDLLSVKNINRKVAENIIDFFKN